MCCVLGRRHCITGVGFQGQFSSEGDEESALSPETCYECKINGGASQSGRRRRNAADNELNVSLKYVGMSLGQDTLLALDSD